MKKALSLALCGALIFSLAGCGGKQAAEEQSPATSETPVVSEQAEETKNSAQENVQSSESIEKLGAGVVDTEQQVIDNLSIDLSDLTESQKDLFVAVAHSFIDNVLEGSMTTAEMAESQSHIIDTYIMTNELPDNAQKLFGEWKESVNYYELLADWLLDKGVMEEAEAVRPVLPEEEVEEKVESKPIVQNQNKPKPTEKQEQTQHKEATQKPVKPSNNTPSDGEVVGTPGDVVSAGGGNGDNFTKAEDVIGDFDDLMASAIKSEANRIAKEKGISYEEALKLVQSGN